MTIHLADKSKVSVRFYKGYCKLTYHAINKVVKLDVSKVTVNIGLMQALYDNLARKANAHG